MVFVSVTRLRIRRLRFMPGFIVYAVRSLNQCRRAAGFRGGSLLPDRMLTFWTMTLWPDQAAMRAYMTSGTHRTAMPKLLRWCDEASVVHWTQEDGAVPSWDEADARMRAEGRPSKVLWPSSDHLSLRFAAPRVARATRIVPA